MATANADQGTTVARVRDGRGQRANRTYISRDQIEELVQASGLETEEKAAWVKVKAPGREDAAIYYPRRNGISTVHISGFTLDADEFGVFDLDEDERIGRVHQMMDFGLEEKEILRNVKKVLQKLKHIKDEDVFQPRSAAASRTLRPAARTARAKKNGRR